MGESGDISMAEIIDLERWRAIRRQPRTVAAGPARILLFLGVRYERHQDDHALPASKRLAGRGKTPSRRRRRNVS